MAKTTKPKEPVIKENLNTDSTAEANAQAQTDVDGKSAVENAQDFPDNIALDENGVPISRATLYRLNPNHPTEHYYRCGIRFIRGEQTEVDERPLSAEQVETLLSDPHLQYVHSIAMTKAEYAEFNAQETH